jgi:hypothetical protein
MRSRGSERTSATKTQKSLLIKAAGAAGSRTEQLRRNLDFGSASGVSGSVASPHTHQSVSSKRRPQALSEEASLSSSFASSSIQSCSSIPMSPARLEARQHIADLKHSMADAARRLGNSHPHVEAARTHLIALRKHERELGWTELEHLHLSAIEEALGAGDLATLDRVIVAAASSPLGKGHSAVQYGKRMLEMRTKERTRMEFAAVEAVQVRECRDVKSFLS